jgi:hypothetical protein
VEKVSDIKILNIFLMSSQIETVEGIIKVKVEALMADGRARAIKHCLKLEVNQSSGEIVEYERNYASTFKVDS